MTGTAFLSQEDIDRLMTDRSVKSQMEIVKKLTEQYTAEGEYALNAKQMEIANDIFQRLLSRADMMVRAMLAMNLSQTDKLPPALARQIALDVSHEVAVPVLQYSKSLNDEVLAEIIHSMSDTEKLKAIASRETISEMVSDLLTDTKIEPVVNELIKNEGANINKKTFRKIIENHVHNAEIVDSIFQRSLVPIEMVETVIEHLSGRIRDELEKKYGDLHELKEMKKALAQSLELTSFKMMGFKSTDRELIQLVRQLDKNNRLPPFSALTIGNIQLFEVSLSRLLHIPLRNVHILLQDAAGFKVLYERAHLPPQLLEATMLAVNAIRSLEQENLNQHSHIQLFNPIQIIKRMEKLTHGKHIEGFEALTTIMQHCAH